MSIWLAVAAVILGALSAIAGAALAEGSRILFSHTMRVWFLSNYRASGFKNTVRSYLEEPAREAD